MASLKYLQDYKASLLFILNPGEQTPVHFFHILQNHLKMSGYFSFIE